MSNYKPENSLGTTRKDALESVSSLWKERNLPDLQLAGDGARRSIDKGFSYANDFLGDADFNANLDKILTASVKWALATDTNDERLKKQADFELMDSLAPGSVGTNAIGTPSLSEYTRKKDEYDYKTGRYTTTENASKTPTAQTRELQTLLNRGGYTDRFGNTLKEDGLLGAKTLYAANQAFTSTQNVDAVRTNATESKSNLSGIQSKIYGTQYPDYKYIEKKYDANISRKAIEHAIAANSKSVTYMEQNGYDKNWDNPVDAYRHFVWNAALTRDLGKYKARYIGNLHEYLDMESNSWISRGNLEQENMIYTKMNQPILMDLWNNAVGRTMACNSIDRNQTVDDLFNTALKNGWLITDATKVYEFLGITDCIDGSSYTVNVKWNTDTGNITVYDKNGQEYVTLKIGV